MRQLRFALLAALFAGASGVSAEPQRLLIAPLDTDARLAADEAPHLVAYEREASGTPLLWVWLAGTNGHPDTGPRKLFATVLAQGYRLVGVSYLSAPAVSQVCTQRRVREQPRCAEQFRQQRVWGDPGPAQDRREDAIVPRLTQLLRHLVKTDPAGDWARYLDAEQQPRWALIAVAGQSQGGGMAGYLAKSRKLAGVMMFSGGWDFGPDGIAGWYRRDSATPPERMWGTYHVDENQADTMARIYRTMGLAAEHVHALNLPVRPGGLPHGEGIANPVYEPLWRQMLSGIVAQSAVP